MLDNQFETYQKIVNELLSGEKSENLLKIMKDLKSELDGNINIYAQVSDDYAYQRTKYENRALKMCSLRDLLTTEISKYDTH